MSTTNQLGFFDLANRHAALSQQGGPLGVIVESSVWLS